MHTVDYVKVAVIHLNRDLLPSLELHIPLGEQEPVIGVTNRVDATYDLPLQIDQLVDIGVDLIFKRDYLDYEIFYFAFFTARSGYTLSRYSTPCMYVHPA